MRVEDSEARAYYLKKSAEQGWSVRTLERNVNTYYYQRLLSSRNKPETMQHTESSEKGQPPDFIKDPFIFEFLNLPQPTSATEIEIESALIDNLQQFLLELGKGFSFIGRQFRISTETDHFFIDLVFYNYLLKCFVLILPFHPVEYIGPGNNAYKKTKSFYITPLGNIYAWKFE